MNAAYQLYEHTQELLKAVNALDLPRLRDLVADDFGIVDVDPQGNSIVINDMEAWESYMQKNMTAMQQSNAKLAFDIDEYHENVAESMAYVVVKFEQRVAIAEQEMIHDCIATIVWKKIGPDWKEARWHCSRLPSA